MDSSSLTEPLVVGEHSAQPSVSVNNPLSQPTGLSEASATDGNSHIVIITSGSRGDVQPYIALGLSFKVRGNSVTIATERRMENLVREFDLDYFPVEGDPTGVIYEKDAQKALQDGSMMKLIKLTEEWDKKFNKLDIYNSIYNACAGDANANRRMASIIIASPLTMTPSYCVAEKLKLPWIPVILGPTMPTNEFPIWPLAKIIPCSCLNKWSYNLAFKMLWKSESKFINPWRVDTLGLLPMIDTPRGIADVIDRIHPPILIASSKLLCGRRGEVPTDYPSNCHVVGFYFVPPTAAETINPEINEFFSSHHKSGNLKTVYLGFGSMPAENPVELVKLAVEITEKCNCRAVLVAGWSEMGSPECIAMMNHAIEAGKLLVLKSVPHDWILPRVDCIVHHCGVSSS